MKPPKIEPELECALEKLPTEKLEGLRNSIRKEGCRDPLVIWKEKNVLVDGHNRLKICRQLRKPFRIVRLSFKDILEAKSWAIENQKNRRNETEESLRLRRAALFEQRVKADGAGRPKKCGQNDHISGRTQEVLAEEFKVSPKTVQRDVALARGLAAMTPLVPTIRDDYLRGKLDKKDVDAIQRVGVKAVLSKNPELPEIIKRNLNGAATKAEKDEYTKLAEANEKRPVPFMDVAVLTDVIDATIELKEAPLERVVAYLKETALGQEHVRDGHLDLLATFWPRFIEQLQSKLV